MAWKKGKAKVTHTAKAHRVTHAHKAVHKKSAHAVRHAHKRAAIRMRKVSQ